MSFFSLIKWSRRQHLKMFIDLSADKKQTKQCYRPLQIWDGEPCRLTPRKFPGQISTVVSLCGVRMFSLCMCGFSGFLPLSKNMLVRLIGESKWTVGSVHGCLSLSLALRWIGDLPRVYFTSRPMVAEIGFITPATPNGIKGVMEN